MIPCGDLLGSNTLLIILRKKFEYGWRNWTATTSLSMSQVPCNTLLKRCILRHTILLVPGLIRFAHHKPPPQQGLHQ